jgi:hypothetical protein
VTAWPATFNVPLLVAALYFSTENCIRPLPVPAEPETTVIQLTSLAAVQAQWDIVVMLTATLSAPFLSTLCRSGATTYVHGAAC